MRLHSLEVTAFGPFTDTVTVDFDTLSDAGLFLLTGPTGAGKTSILDAVCFGLYGVVPGDRADAGHLRSDQAAPDVTPRVVLTISVGSRTFRFTRSPGWERPKKRGTGTTTARPSVVVEERSGDGWRPLTTRLDDAGLLVGDLLGMTATQFTQVAMLPQGRFQAFLRARSEERRAVLQRLFRTDRFQAVERWLVERRTDLRRAGQRAQEQVAAVVNRLQEAAHTPVPEEWDVHDLTLPADDGALVAWADELRTASDAAAVDSEQATTAARAVLAEADATLDHAEAVARAQQRGHRARAELQACAEQADEAARWRAALALHERAHPVAELAARARSAGEVADHTRERAARAARAAGRALQLEAVPAPDELQQQLSAVQSRRAVTAAFAPREAELVRLGAERDAATTSKGALADAMAGAETDLEILPGLVRQTEQELESVRRVAAGCDAATRRVEDAQRAHAAAVKAVQLRSEVDAAQDELRLATDAEQALRDAYQDVREERIGQMAAELAHGLAVGGSCPVCGSAEHPAPAVHVGTPVGRADEDSARRAYEQAGFERQAHAEKVRTLATELRLAEETSGGDAPDLLRQELARATTDAAMAAKAQDRLDALTRALAELRERSNAAGARVARARAEQAALEARLVALTEQLAALEAERTRVLGGTGSSVAAMLDELDRLLDTLAEAVAAADRARQAERARDEAAAAAEAAARRAGLDDLDALEEALLGDEHREELTRMLAAHDDRLATARATLAEDDVARWLDVPVPDLDAARAHRREAAESVESAVSVSDAARRRADRVGALRSELDAALAAWAPVREQLAVASRLATLAEGKGPDNPQRVSLSAYVLGERLRQVVAAANERLAAMTDQRYSLEHTDDRGAGETRGGLSLLVRDDWSGVRRDPATLSGGEMFLASLALALGLADTVSHEAGGTDIDTLFIDEGFGSLDSDTLEDVMDTLDRLRDGGRVVGVVSHVAEMRSRITTQLEVRKGRSGSVAVPVLAGS